MFKSIILLTFLISLTQSLGINCRGSGLCGGTQSNLDGILYEAKLINNNREYKAGEYIICLPSSKILNTVISDNGGLCVFYQGEHLWKGRNKGNWAKTLLNRLKAHGCKKCGSAPLAYETNDPSRGILTVNYVNDRRGCLGVCR